MRATSKRNGWALGLLLTLIIVPVSRSATAASAGLIEKVGAGSIDWHGGEIAVTGIGASPDRGNPAQKRLLARRAAVVDGYRQIAEIINGVRVDSETVVKDFVVASDTIKTQVSALVKGARVGDTRYLSDGAVETDLRVSLYGNGSLADAVDLEKAPHHHPLKSGALPATYDLGPDTAAWQLGLLSRHPFRLAQGAPYTGLIIDCSATDLQPAMSPAVLDEHDHELYIGNLPIDPDMVVNQGIVSYKASLAEARADAGRAGDNPLVLTALHAGGGFRADAVLSADDSRALSAADQVTRFLAQTRVSFIVTR